MSNKIYIQNAVALLRAEGYEIKAPVEPERIEVERVYYLHDNPFGSGGVYGFSTTKKITVDFPVIKEAIEGVLNPKTEASHTPAPERDWQIECIVCNGANYWRQISGGYHSQPFTADKSADEILRWKGSYIWQVRRLSDNTVWSLQEDTPKGKISKFELPHPDGDIYIRYDLGGWDYIHQCKKLPPKPQSLFVTEDGKEIFDGDKFWFVWHKEPARGQVVFCPYTSYGEKCFVGENYAFDFAKYFSTEEAANNWVVLHKPCLSVYETIGVWANADYFPEAVERIAKSKQSKTN